MCIKKLIKSALFFIILIVTFSPSVFSYEAVVLSDQELDDIFVGGFEFNINAAYAFRAAVVSQMNMAAAACVNTNSSVSISATNKAVLMNLGDSAAASQTNISAVVATLGDIADATIDNLNVSEVLNIVMDEVGSEIESVSSDTSVDTQPLNGIKLEGLSFSAELESTPETPKIVGAFPADAISTSCASSFETSILTGATNNSTPKTDTPETICATPVSTNGSVSSNSVETPTISGSINEVAAKASAVAAQTNIAALIALNGGIGNSSIKNTNVASVKNQGNSALAAQTNIAVVIAKSDIGNAIVQNVNLALAENIFTTESGGAFAVSLSSTGILMNIDVNDVCVAGDAKTSQTNITIIKSLGGSIKNKVIKELNLGRVLNIR